MLQSLTYASPLHYYELLEDRGNLLFTVHLSELHETSVVFLVVSFKCFLEEKVER